MSQFIEPEIHIGCIGPGNPMTFYFYLFEVHKMYCAQDWLFNQNLIPFRLKINPVVQLNKTPQYSPAAKMCVCVEFLYIKYSQRGPSISDESNFAPATGILGNVNSSLLMFEVSLSLSQMRGIKEREKC